MTKTERIHTEYNQKLSLPCCLRDHIINLLDRDHIINPLDRQRQPSGQDVLHLGAGNIVPFQGKSTLWVGDGEWEDIAETNPYRICWRSWRIAIRKGFFLPVDSLAKPTRFPLSGTLINGGMV